MGDKTRQEIEIDFSRAFSQAQELENLANDLSRAANRGAGPALLMLKNTWKGDTGESIELAGAGTIEDIYRTADDLMRIAKNIRSTADIVYRAEKAALKLCF